MNRTNLYLTERQMERLKQRSEYEGLSLAELVRRAVDAFLAWDDPTYAPNPVPGVPQKERRFHWPFSSPGWGRPHE
jgi:Ribbon-helix-helix protein, copG family